MQFQPHNLSEIVSNLSKMLKRIIGEHIQLQYQCESGLPLVNADDGMIEQVLVNLAVNARDAMPHGGQLVVSTAVAQLDSLQARNHEEARPGRFVTLRVADTGSGIAAEHLPHIFEPFFTTKAVGQGTGLGLATVYGIVKQHQGWIDVSTKVGKGTVFTLFLPIVEATVRVPVQLEDSCDQPPRGTERILLVEDEDAVRLLSRRLLEKFGYTVYEAASGRSALTMCRAQSLQFDLLLTDVIMPEGVSGRDLAEELRADNPRLKVILMSGYSGDILGHDTQFVRRTNSRFIAKPCSPQLLLDTIREYLDERGPDA